MSCFLSIDSVFLCLCFQDLEQSMFFTRCKDGSKKNNLYFASHLVRDIMDNNVDGKVKIINTGIKAFTKCENKGATCPYR